MLILCGAIGLLSYPVWHPLNNKYGDLTPRSTDGVCPCTCNYATDPTCSCRDIASPVNVTVTKSPVYATYPLIYEKSYNSKPYEVLLPDVVTAPCSMAA